MTGKTISHYQVLEKLGEGGMGVVYKAHDTHLDRLVAMKLLPLERVADPERKRRFVQEAKAASALNHPNIVTIYDIETAEGVTFISMEFVKGKTLDWLIGSKKNSLDEMLKFAVHIADALAAAHSAGIVHRDIKPANVIVGEAGQVKVLDFGLAKLTDTPPPGENGITRTMDAATQEGTVFGTLAYMSPEQVRGRPVDKRADIWAFGCVLFELVTGKKAFFGESASDVLASILKAEPDWAALPPETPSGILRLLRRCLQKDPERRLHDMTDARIELEEAAPGIAATAAPLPAKARQPGRYAWAALLLLAVAAFAAGSWWWHSAGFRNEAAWTGVRLGGSMVALGPRVSPDGQLVAFQAMVAGITQVAVMKPQSGNWRILTEDRTRGCVKDICWSHDGTKLYYDRYQAVFKGIFSVPVLGGEERLVAEDAGFPMVLPDRSLLLARTNEQRRQQLFHLWPETGRVEALNALVCFRVASSTIRASPSGNRVVFLGTPADHPDAPDRLYAMDLPSGRIVRVAPEVDVPVTNPFALALTVDGKTVLFSLPARDLRNIVSAPADGSEGLRTLLTLTTATGYLDAGTDGSLYADQWERPFEVVQFAPGAAKVESIGTAAEELTLPLADGRIVFCSRTSGRWRLVAAAPGREPEPLVETELETHMPATLVGSSTIAFLLGNPPDQSIALASTLDGRIIRRLRGGTGSGVRSMAASPDGANIYYTAGGSLWSVPSVDGNSVRLGSGDAVTVDAKRGDLLVRLDQRDGIRLVRRSLSGGPDRPVPVDSSLRLVAGGGGLSPTAVHADGRILVQVTAGSSWFWPAAALDPSTGRARLMRVSYPADMPAPGWTPDGNVVGVAAPLRSCLWHFRRAEEQK